MLSPKARGILPMAHDKKIAQAYTQHVQRGGSSVSPDIGQRARELWSAALALVGKSKQEQEWGTRAPLR